MKLETSGRFLWQLLQSDPHSQPVVIWEGAGFHPRAGHACIPAGVHVLTLPAYSPELNPVKKIGSFIKDAVCNAVFGTIAEIEAVIAKELEALWQGGAPVAQLIGEGWLTSQVNTSAKN